MSEHQWFCIQTGMFNDEQIGPISEQEVQKKILSGELKANTQVASPTRTQNQWVGIETVPEFKRAFDHIELERQRAVAEAASAKQQAAEQRAAERAKQREESRVRSEERQRQRAAADAERQSASATAAASSQSGRRTPKFSFSNLLDWKFETFFTPTYVRLVYFLNVIVVWVAYVVGALAIAISMMISVWGENFSTVIASVFIALMLILFYTVIYWVVIAIALVSLRLALEAILVFFRIEEHLQYVSDMIESHAALAASQQE